MPRFKIYYDSVRGPHAKIVEAKSHEDAQRKYMHGMRGLFGLCVLDLDERDPEADVMRLADDLDLWIELSQEGDTVTIRKGETRIAVPLAIVKDLADNLILAKILCDELTSARKRGQKHRAAVARRAGNGDS